LNYDNIFYCRIILGWFGLRQDACGWVLHLCPIFETYANIEYHFPPSNSPATLDTVDSTTPVNRNTRRYFFRKKTSSFCDQTKIDHSENELLTTVILSPLNILKLHEPD
jgi:hypothetical protein